MKALTLHQPWASLVAMGVKTVETRGWSTKYRGPLAIHAGKKRPDFWHDSFSDKDFPEWADRLDMQRFIDPQESSDGEWWRYRWTGPLGAVVATCTLLGVVPVEEIAWWTEDWTPDQATWWQCPPLEANGCGRVIVRADQRPYGDYAAGRFAWLLADVRRLDQPVPAKGRQGLWDWEPAAAEHGMGA